MNLFIGNSIWKLVVQSDAITQSVLLLLLLLSILTWTIFLYKLFLGRTKKRQLRIVARELRQAQTVDDLLTIATHYSDTLPGYFLSTNLLYLKSLLERSSAMTTSTSLWDAMHQHIEQTLDASLAEEESYLPLLSTTAAVSPLLGLFGTVWGLIHAFLRISETQAADITVIAPGIAEALITTLVGLIVAIPALAMYNYLAHQIRSIEQLLLQLAHKVDLVMQRLFLKG